MFLYLLMKFETIFILFHFAFKISNRYLIRSGRSKFIIDLNNLKLIYFHSIVVFKMRLKILVLIVIVSLINLMLIGLPALAGDEDRKTKSVDRKMLEPQDIYKIKIETGEGIVDYNWTMLEHVGFIMFWVSEDLDSYESDFFHIGYDIGAMADSFFCEEGGEYYFIWKNTQETGSYNISFHIYYPEQSNNDLCGSMTSAPVIGTIGLLALLILITRK